MSWLSKLTGVDIKISGGKVKRARVDWEKVGKNLLIGALAPQLLGTQIPIFSDVAQKLGLTKLTGQILSKTGLEKLFSKMPQLKNILGTQAISALGGGDITSLLGIGGLPQINWTPIIATALMGYGLAKTPLERAREAQSQLFGLIPQMQQLLEPARQQIPLLSGLQNQLLNLMMARLPRR